MPIWIDGFNLFHRWSVTSTSFKDRNSDIGQIQEQAISDLASYFTKIPNGLTVFMDGGISRHSLNICGLRVHFPGPGKKADDQLKENLIGRSGGQKVTAVSSDRALAAQLRQLGAKICTTEDFIKQYLAKKQKKGKINKSESYKNQKLSESDVNEWLDYFEEE